MLSFQHSFTAIVCAFCLDLLSRADMSGAFVQASSTTSPEAPSTTSPEAPSAMCILKLSSKLPQSGRSWPIGTCGWLSLLPADSLNEVTSRALSAMRILELSCKLPQWRRFWRARPYIDAKSAETNESRSDRPVDFRYDVRPNCKACDRISQGLRRSASPWGEASMWYLVPGIGCKVHYEASTLCLSSAIANENADHTMIW